MMTDYGNSVQVAINRIKSNIYSDIFEIINFIVHVQYYILPMIFASVPSLFVDNLGYSGTESIGVFKFNYEVELKPDNKFMIGFGILGAVFLVPSLLYFQVHCKYNFNSKLFNPTCFTLPINIILCTIMYICFLSVEPYNIHVSVKGTRGLIQPCQNVNDFTPRNKVYGFQYNNTQMLYSKQLPYADFIFDGQSNTHEFKFFDKKLGCNHIKTIKYDFNDKLGLTEYHDGLYATDYYFKILYMFIFTTLTLMCTYFFVNLNYSMIKNELKSMDKYEIHERIAVAPPPEIGSASPHGIEMTPAKVV